MNIHLTRVFRIGSNGDLSLPYVGHIDAGGMTASQLEAEIESRLKRFVKSPGVVVNISSFGGQPVSVLGSVNTPGIVQLQGRKNLFEVLCPRRRFGSRCRAIASPLLEI